ncbi:copper chaperone PCu(A)C [Vibrio sinaloensis]|uniref:copper chaperone PCu(A)C n=1 Tax=Photobacterium sp. (strain ATCC 43367) TaxID=379097 RepID=UPI002056A4BB|nr:copper chaperone PCu(A)C [Vibrio sinaloensis]UPQ90236.1 copper chaperone PCu(A)C [Vibrio sinaloensis]
MKLKALLLATLMLSPLAYAKTDIMTHHPYARATPPNAPTSAVFLEVMNRGDNDRYIVSATTPAAGKVELHDVIKDGDVMKMRQVERIQVPAKGKAVLKPGSLHIMLFELQQPFVEGEQIDVQITFADGEQQTFSAPIKKVMSGMKHH